MCRLRHLTDEALGHTEDTGLDVVPEDVQDGGQIAGELASLQVHQVLGEGCRCRKTKAMPRRISDIGQ